MYKYICNEEKQSSLIHLTYFVYLFFVCCVCLFVCCVCFLLHLLVCLLCLFFVAFACFFVVFFLLHLFDNAECQRSTCALSSSQRLYSPLVAFPLSAPTVLRCQCHILFLSFLPPASSCQRCCCVLFYQMNFFMWFLCICT